MVGAHQNINGSCDVTTPLSAMVCHPWTSTFYDRLICLKSIFTHHEDTVGDAKCRKWGGFG